MYLNLNNMIHNFMKRTTKFLIPQKFSIILTKGASINYVTGSGGGGVAKLFMFVYVGGGGSISMST